MQWWNSVQPRIYFIMNRYATGYNQRMGLIFCCQALSYWVWNVKFVRRTKDLLHHNYIVSKIDFLWNKKWYALSLSIVWIDGKWFMTHSLVYMHSTRHAFMDIDYVSFFKDEYCSRIHHLCSELISYVFCNLKQIITMMPIYLANKWWIPQVCIHRSTLVVIWESYT
jgi:hypothetical protein